MFADVQFSTEALTVVGGLGAGLVTAVVFLFKQLMAAKDKQVIDMTSSRDSYREIAQESIDSVEKIVNRLRSERGEPEFEPIKPVVAEHSSPTLEVQKQAAELQTMRARLVAATLNLDLPARKASRAATVAEEKEKE